MLWREHYEPVVKQNLVLPVSKLEWLRGEARDTSHSVWICGFGLNAVADQGVWWRLMQSEFQVDPDVYRVFIRQDWTTKQKRDALASVPPSEHSTTLLMSDSQNSWKNLIQPDKPERGFAVVIKGQLIERLVIGPPTEEVWEAYSNLWRSLRK
jgi:hypothetical protein